MQYRKYVRSIYLNDELELQIPSIPDYLSFDKKLFETALVQYSEDIFSGTFKKVKFSRSDIDYRMKIDDDSSQYSCSIFTLGRPDGSPHFDVQMAIFNGSTLETEFKASFLLMRNFWVFGKKNMPVYSEDLESVLQEPMELLRIFVSFFKRISSY